MSSPFEISLKMRDKVLRYYSESKVFDRKREKPTGVRNLDLDLPGLKVRGEGAGHNMRDTITEINEGLQKSDRIHYSTSCVTGEYLLFRALVTAGTIWDYCRDDDDPGGFKNLKDTVWWMGESESFDIVAYGKRRNIIGGGDSGGEEDAGKSTWDPSDFSVNLTLVEAINEAVKNDEQFNLEMHDTEKFSRFRGSFHDGTARGVAIEGRGLFEFLLRFDACDFDGEREVVYGSPVWVAKVTDPVPGTYNIGKFWRTIAGEIVKVRQGSDQEVGDVKKGLGIWDGEKWKSTRWASSQSAYLWNPPPIPEEYPSVGDFVGFATDVPSEETTSRWSERFRKKLTNFDVGL